MAYSIKKHEVDRILNVAVALGWSLKQEKYSGAEITIELTKVLSEDLLKAAGELEIGSSPQ